METYRAGYSGRPCLNLSSSVGWGYRYLVWDAKLVQYLLNVGNSISNDGPMLEIDGKIGRLSDQAIRANSRFLGVTHSPGVVSKIVIGGRPHANFYAFELMLSTYNIAGDRTIDPDVVSECVVNEPLPAKYPPMPVDLRAYLKEVWSKA